MPQRREDIRADLQACGRTIADLCRASGLSYNRLHGWIAGYHDLPSEVMNRLFRIVAGWCDEAAAVVVADPGAVRGADGGRRA